MRLSKKGSSFTLLARTSKRRLKWPNDSARLPLPTLPDGENCSHTAGRTAKAAADASKQIEAAGRKARHTGCGTRTGFSARFVAVVVRFVRTFGGLVNVCREEVGLASLVVNFLHHRSAGRLAQREWFVRVRVGARVGLLRRHARLLDSHA